MPLSLNITAAVSHPFKARGTWMCGYRFQKPLHHSREIDLLLRELGR